MKNVGFKDTSLAGIVDLARAAFAAGGLAESILLDTFRANRTVRELIATCFDYWRGNFSPIRPRDHLFSAPLLELWMVRSWDCIHDDGFPLYLQRFERALRANGFGDRFPKALIQAFSEMIENVVRHSSSSGSSSAGVIGYHVANCATSFVVADLGQGVLSGLRGNPKWQQLADEQEALVATARDGATRMTSEETGFGFKRVFKSFLEREGLLALRSCDGAAVFRGNTDRKNVETYPCAFVPGLRVSISLALGSTATELKITP